MADPIINIDLTGIMDANVKALALEELTTMENIITQLKEKGTYTGIKNDPRTGEPKEHEYGLMAAMDLHSMLYRHVQELAGYPASERNYVDPWRKPMGVRSSGRFLNFMAGIARVIKYVFSPSYRRAVKEAGNQAAEVNISIPQPSVKTEDIKDQPANKETVKDPFAPAKKEIEILKPLEGNPFEKIEEKESDKTEQVTEETTQDPKKLYYRKEMEKALEAVKKDYPEMDDRQALVETVKQHYQHYYSLTEDERSRETSAVYLEGLALDKYKKDGHDGIPEDKEKDSLIWKTLKEEIGKHPEVILTIPEDQPNKIAVAAAKSSRGITFLSEELAKAVMSGDVFFENIAMTGKKGEKVISEAKLIKNLGYLQKTVKEQMPEVYKDFMQNVSDRLDRANAIDIKENISEFMVEKPVTKGPFDDIAKPEVKGPFDTEERPLTGPFAALENAKLPWEELERSSQNDNIPPFEYKEPELHQEDIKEDAYNNFTSPVFPDSNIIFGNPFENNDKSEVVTKEGAHIVEGEVGDILIPEEKERAKQESMEDSLMEEIQNMEELLPQDMQSIVEDERFSPKVACMILLRDPELIMELPDPEADGRYDPAYDIDGLADGIAALIKEGYEKSGLWSPDMIQETTNQEVISLDIAVDKKLAEMSREDHDMER